MTFAGKKNTIIDTCWDVGDAVFLLTPDLYNLHALYNNLLVFLPIAPGNMQHFHIIGLLMWINMSILQVITDVA